MHLRILALMALAAAHADGFVGYGLVYAVYFFPWRAWRHQAPARGQIGCANAAGSAPRTQRNASPWPWPCRCCSER